MPETSVNSVTINSKSWSEGEWTVDCVISTADGVRSGRHCVQLPEEASVEELNAALLALYGA